MVLTIQNRITRKVTNRSATLSTTNHVNWPGIKPKPQHQLLLQTERQVGSVEERERPGEKWDTLLFQGRQKQHHFECFQHSLIVLMIEHPNHISTPNPRPALMFLVQTFKMRKMLLNFPLARPKYNAKSFLKYSELSPYGDVHYITNYFLKMYKKQRHPNPYVFLNVVLLISVAYTFTEQYVKKHREDYAYTYLLICELKFRLPASRPNSAEGAPPV